MKSGRQFMFGLLVLLSLAPGSAFASKTATVVRTRDFTYRDRTPRVHDAAPKQHPRQRKS
jgi:hypothetical protein